MLKRITEKHIQRIKEKYSKIEQTEISTGKLKLFC